jgi:hypothetical protein
MLQFLHWWMQVLLLCGGHQEVIDVVGGWYEAAIEQQALELVLNRHSRAMLLNSRPTAST